MGGGKGGSSAPPPIDPGKSMGEYLFGRGFATQYQGITDPRLQERLIKAESTYRPQYTALELADIGVMARGLEGGKESYQYKILEAELAGLEAGQEYRSLNTEERRAAVEAKADAIFGAPKEPKGLVGALYKSAKEAGKLNGKTRGPFPTGKGAAPSGRNAYIEAALSDGGDSAERIAQIKAQMKQLEDAPDIPGLFDLLEEQSRRAGALQREELQMQRESDVGALQEFAPQVVEAYRAADPYSTALAEEASARAMDSGLMEKGQELLNAKLEAASAAESALQSKGLSDIDAKREAASAAEQKLNQVGMSLSDLSPTEQEAILSGRGMEFAASTGELSALEKRRAQQASRQASVSRGRGMDQSAIYGEMQARMAEELNKREREIALGSSLLGQASQMRLNRLGQGAGTLGQAEAMAAQRRAEELQRQQFGAGLLGQSEAMAAQRRGELLQKQQLGAGLIGKADQQLAGAFSMNRQLAGDVGMTILGRPSASIGLGGSMLGQAQAGAAGPMGPQLFDPNVGINMALQQRGQDVTFQGMQAQAKAAGQAGFMGAIGGIGGGLLGNTSLF